MNRIDLNDRITVFTGGAQGIGRAVAERMIASGARVAIWDRDEALGAQVAAEIGASFVAVQQTDFAAVQSALAATGSALRGVDVLVANAGIAGMNATVADYPVNEWRAIIDIYLTGVFHCCKAVVPGMWARGYGRIVNIASIAGKEGNPNAAVYSASKAGVIALTKSLDKQLAGGDIAVNCVTPAAVHTRIFEQMTEEHIGYMLSRIPRGRFLAREEAAAMICWLASAENSFTTGAVFDLSGGRAIY